MVETAGDIASSRLQSTCRTPCRPYPKKKKRASPHLVIWATKGSAYKKATRFIISTVKRKGCSQKNFFSVMIEDTQVARSAIPMGCYLQDILLQCTVWVCPAITRFVEHIAGLKVTLDMWPGAAAWHRPECTQVNRSVGLCIQGEAN